MNRRCERTGKHKWNAWKLPRNLFAPGTHYITRTCRRSGCDATDRFLVEPDSL